MIAGSLCWLVGGLGPRLVAWLALTFAAAAAVSAQPAWQPVTVTDDRGRAVVLDQPVRRVVSLMPSLTETVCALGACDRLVGVDRWSNWPAAVRALPQLGGLEDTPLERIVRLQPDLVLAPSSSRAIERMEALGLKVLALEPKSLDETRRLLSTVAQALGRPGQGEALWARIDARVTAAGARTPAAFKGQRVYFEVSSAPYAAGEASFVGALLARLGLRNIVPAAMGPFPKLNPEFVVRAQPELLMASNANLADMAKRPGWAAISALGRQRTCGFAAAQVDMLARPGPRLAEAAELIADCLVRLGAASP